MGSAKMNIEMVQDYSTKEYFIRLHRDIKVPNKDAIMIRKYVDSGDMEKAVKLLKRTAPEETHSLIDLFWSIFPAE